MKTRSDSVPVYPDSHINKMNMTDQAEEACNIKYCYKEFREWAHYDRIESIHCTALLALNLVSHVVHKLKQIRR
jgi:hypothetical protein